MSNYIRRKVWDEVTYTFPNFGNEFVISTHALLGMWLLTHAEI